MTRLLLLLLALPLAGCLGGSGAGTCRGGDPNEPNDETATLLASGETLSGCVDADGDRDLIQLDAPTEPAGGGWWRLELLGPVEGDALLEVRDLEVDTAGITRPIAAEDTPTTLHLGAGPGSSLELALATDGGDAALGYDLTASWTELDDAYEPNQTPATAAEVHLGQSVSAWCNGSVGDPLSSPQDWYRVAAPDGPALVTITSSPSDLRLEVVDANDASLGSATAAGEGFAATIEVIDGGATFGIAPLQEEDEAVLGDAVAPPPAFVTPCTFTVTQ